MDINIFSLGGRKSEKEKEKIEFQKQIWLAYFMFFKAVFYSLKLFDENRFIVVYFQNFFFFVFKAKNLYHFQILLNLNIVIVTMLPL